MLDFLEKLDHWLFHALNSSIANPFFDQLLPAITDLHKEPFFTYAVLPLLLSLWVFLQRMTALKLLLGLALCIGCVDMITYRVLKPSFQRQRPPAVLENLELRTDRYAGFSFPSNHASNNFAAATFLSLSYPALSPVFFTVAFLIALSRVYVGVHFPFDVLVGALWASLFAFGFFQIWKRTLKLPKRK